MVRIHLLQFHFIYLFVIYMFVRYYHNITSNTLLVLESMAKHDVKTLIYSSTCATYGEPEKMPITEETKQVGNITVVKLWGLVENMLCFSLHLYWL